MLVKDLKVSGFLKHGAGLSQKLLEEKAKEAALMKAQESCVEESKLTKE